MKAHSILTTLFPRLGINRYPISDLYRICKVPGGGTKGPLFPFLCQLHEAGGDKFATVPNFLPSFVIAQNREGFTPKEVHCHLMYSEIPSSSPSLEKTKNPAVAYVWLRASGDGGTIAHKFGGAGSDFGSAYLKLWNICEDPSVKRIDYTINILISSEVCVPTAKPDDGVDNTRNLILASERRVLLAGELTTGYRRYISAILLLIKAFTDCSKDKTRKNGKDVISPICKITDWGIPRAVKPGSGTDSESHSTKEDAWRLLCTFRTIEKRAKATNMLIFNGDLNATPMMSLNAFIDSCTTLHSETPTIQTAIGDMFNSLYKARGISPEIVLRKALEYYMYEGLPSIPEG